MIYNLLVMADSPAPNSPAWSRTTRIFVLVVLIVILLALIILAWPLFQALVIAGLLAYLLDPLVLFFMKGGRMKRSWATILVYTLFLLVIAAIPALVGTLVYTWFDELTMNLSNAWTEMQRWLTRPIIILGVDLSPRTLFDSLTTSMGSTVSSISGNSFQILSNLTTNILAILVGLVSLFYLLRDGVQIKPWFEEQFLPEYRPEVTRLLNEIDQVWRLFLRVQIIIFIVLAILMLIGAVLVIWLYQLGLIPFSTLGLIVMLIIVYALVQQVDNLWLRPQMLGHHLRIHPGVVFVGLIIGLAIGNILGAILAVPIIATAKILWRYVQHKMAGRDPWAEDEMVQPADPQLETGK